MGREIRYYVIFYLIFSATYKHLKYLILVNITKELFNSYLIIYEYVAT